MIITVLTMFPEIFDSFLASPIPKRAVDRGAAVIRLIDIKEYAGGSFRHIDDSTFGGGAGMVLRAAPVLKALQQALKDTPSRHGSSQQDIPSDKTLSAAQSLPDTQALPSVPGSPSDYNISSDMSSSSEQNIYSAAPASAGSTCSPEVIIAALTPAGHLYNQQTAARYSHLDHLVLICGHYEGMDERICSHVDERISIGDYVLSGGETAAMVVMDSILRLLPGVLRHESTQDESFTPALNGLLEYPQYTRPADLDGDRVPEVLLSGNHEEIRRWRLEKSLETTLTLRPELLLNHSFTEEELIILRQIAANAGTRELNDAQRRILAEVLRS